MDVSTKSEAPLRERGLLTRLLRTRPLALAAALFLIGCALEFQTGAPAWAALGALLALLALCLALRRHKRLAAALMMLALLPAGMLRFEAAWSAGAPLPERRDAQISGRIAQEPEYDAESQRTICVLEEFSVDGAPQRGKIRLYLRGDEALLRGVRLGQCVDATAHLWRADGRTNPGQFDFDLYLRVRGLRNYATAKIENASFSDGGFRLGDLPERARIALGERIDRLFPRHAALARALVLGDRGGLSAQERADYARSGAAHLLAISGMHLSVLAWLIALLLGRFLKRPAAYGITLALLAAYAVLTGLAPSVTRALLMYAILGLAPLVGRRSDGLTRLGAAMLLQLLLRPSAFLDAGFVLSYGATAGLFLLAPPLSRLPLLRWGLKPGADFKRPLRRVVWALCSAVVAALAAQLAVLPAVVHFFGAQPLWGIAANLLAAPLTMLAYVPALLATLANFAPLAAAADALFELLSRLVAGIASLPLAQIRAARFPLWLILLCIAVSFAASELSRLPKRLRAWLPFAVLLAIPASNLLAWQTTLGVSVVFLDAGQADCAVIRSEGSVYLVDAGDAYSPAADYLSAMNYVPEAVFLTHAHADHAAGLGDMLEICTPRRIYLPSGWDNFETGEQVAEALERARADGAEICYLSAGDVIALSEHVQLRVLSPKEGISPNSANEDSLILLLEYGDARALFLADAPSEVTAGLAGDVDLLKVAHHGSRDGTDAALLAETLPSAAVISVGRDNSYGHPADQVLAMLEAAGAQIYRTDRSGAVTCWMDADGSLRLRGYLASEVEDGVE